MSSYVPVLSAPFLQAITDTQMFPNQQRRLSRALAFALLVL